MSEIRKKLEDARELLEAGFPDSAYKAIGKALSLLPPERETRGCPYWMGDGCAVDNEPAHSSKKTLRERIGVALDTALHSKVTDTTNDTIGSYQKWREETLDALLASSPAPETPKEACDWIEDSSGIWNGSCGIVWEISNDDGPAENEMHYCPKCGKPLVENPYCDDEDERSATT